MFPTEVTTGYSCDPEAHRGRNHLVILHPYMDCRLSKDSQVKDLFIRINPLGKKPKEKVVSARSLLQTVRVSHFFQKRPQAYAMHASNHKPAHLKV